MPISLFTEHHQDGISFYINGDLQFDTSDEGIYHEYLVIPSIALAQKRFTDELRILICGGGDGLAAREVLKFSQVNQVDLVDYNPDVLELGKTEFKRYNRGSLESDRLTISVRDALEFVSTLPDNYYHAVIGDFTYPTSLEDTKVYSKEWFEGVKRVLHPSGIFATNGASPENRTTGFWCLYQTILAAGLKVKPLQIAIPSFRHHGYGNWGFFLGSETAIDKAELRAIALLKNLDFLKVDKLLSAFVFDESIANVRERVNINTIESSQLFYYLLNPTPQPPPSQNTIDFLEIDELGTNSLDSSDSLKLESTAQAWLKELNSTNPPKISQLLPVQHRYHTPKMTAEWLAYTKQLLSEIDLHQLLNKLLERSHELPPTIAQELKQLAEKIRTPEQISKVTMKSAEFLALLSLVLLMANLIAPDVVFAKGFYSGSRGSSSGGSSGDFGDNKIWGFIFTGMGGVWLLNIFSRMFNKSNNE